MPSKLLSDLCGGRTGQSSYLEYDVKGDVELFISQHVDIHRTNEWDDAPSLLYLQESLSR